MKGIGIASLTANTDYSSSKTSVCNDPSNSWNQNGKWMDAVNSRLSLASVNLRWETGDFREWKQAAYVLEYVPAAKDIGARESARAYPIPGSPGGAFKTELDVDTSFRNVGYYLSMIETKRQAISNICMANEFRVFDRFLEEKGYHPSNLDSIGIENLPRGVIAREEFTERGNSITFSRDFAKKIADGAARYGVKIDSKNVYSFEHGMLHFYLSHLPGIRSEKEVEALIQEFYEKLASNEPRGHINSRPGNEKSQRERYLELVKIARARKGEVMKTYFWNRLGRGEKGNELLAEQYATEAVENGCKTEEEIKEYVSERLSKEAGKEERSGLEEKVEESSKQDEQNADREYSEADAKQCEKSEAAEAESTE